MNALDKAIRMCDDKIDKLKKDLIEIYGDSRYSNKDFSKLDKSDLSALCYNAGSVATQFKRKYGKSKGQIYPSHVIEASLRDVQKYLSKL